MVCNSFILKCLDHLTSSCHFNLFLKYVSIVALVSWKFAHYKLHPQLAFWPEYVLEMSEKFVSLLYFDFNTALKCNLNYNFKLVNFVFIFCFKTKLKCGCGFKVQLQI